MNLPKNKLLKWLIIIITIYLGLFLLIKIVNINSKSCNADTDCTYHHSSCFPSCGPNDVINKKYETTKNIELVTKCIPSLPAVISMRNMQIDCFEIYPTTPYCNEEKKCDSKINCEVSCKTYKDVEETQINERILDALNECECEIN